jgi:hypothetical protein
VTESGPPSDDELLKQLEEELKTLEVSDLLVQTLYTVSSLGYRRSPRRGATSNRRGSRSKPCVPSCQCSTESPATSSCGTSSR